MADVPKLDIAGELRVRARVEASRCACLAEELVEYQAAELLATQAAQIEAIKKVRDQYASQAKFADIDCAVHFRDFVRRIDAAIAAVGENT